jgi:membrane fusion protein (multidrug efflux system)
VEESGRKRQIFLLVGTGILAAGIAFFLYWWLIGRYWEGTDNAYVQADAVVISPKVAGYVAEVAVGDNQQVTARQLLVRIDAAPYQASADLADAQVAAGRADLIRYQADVRRQQAIAAEMAAQAAVAETAARLAIGDAGRFERLASTGADTVQRRDTAAAERDMTRSRLAAARAAAESAQRQIAAMEAQVGQGQAALRAAEARSRSAKADLTGGRISSPIAGVIGDRTVRVGQYVQPGTRLMTVVPTQALFLIANFKETQLKRMRVGQPVQVHVDALDGPAIDGIIDSLAPGTGAQFALLPPENATGNFTKIVQRVPVRIRLQLDAAQRAALRPGLSAEVEVDTRGDQRP